MFFIAVERGDRRRLGDITSSPTERIFPAATALSIALQTAASFVPGRCRSIRSIYPTPGFPKAVSIAFSASENKQG